MSHETRNRVEHGRVEHRPDHRGSEVVRSAAPGRPSPRSQVPATGPAAAPVPFATAGDLLRLLGSVPPDTPVRVAETVRVAADLDLRRTPAETMTAMTGLHAPRDEPITTETGIEIGAYVVARGEGPPSRALPFPAYESAVEALQRGDTRTALEAQVELLEWMSGTLATRATDPARPPGATASVADPVLREQFDLESRRIRETARRLEALRAVLPA